ncbi:hypothetical protein SCHPADRAFT_893411 [Schizopora paradoxa]|uniref:Protein kinase domain-containing protein n=1 Tax=Schizopora paradoxa TaxID=27342 RepID=A0A0H2RB20_9AGAM|nr:hypothetical protein SCHPADRAFT_893411 [Schizopora paradoxa]
MSLRELLVDIFSQTDLSLEDFLKKSEIMIELSNKFDNLENVVIPMGHWDTVVHFLVHAICLWVMEYGENRLTKTELEKVIALRTQLLTEIEQPFSESLPMDVDQLIKHLMQNERLEKITGFYQKNAHCSPQAFGIRMKETCYKNSLTDLLTARRIKIFFAIARLRSVVPSSLFLTNIERIGEFPVGRGGYADVWKGGHYLNNLVHAIPEIVALKNLRPSNMSEDSQEAMRIVGREHYPYHLLAYSYNLSYRSRCFVKKLFFGE